MAVLSTDLKFFLSGGADNTNPNASLGGVISSEEVVDDTLNNLFADVSGAEHAIGSTKYRCIYLVNDSASIAYNVKLYIDSNTIAVDDTINIGKDLAGVDGTADTVANEDTAPDPAVTFTTADGYANAIDLGNIPAGQKYAFWIKRIVSAGDTAQADNEATIKVAVDTA
jgi:hypothetical protein